MMSELVIPADQTHVRTARVVAAVAARRCGIAHDDVESVRLAVDEACGLMIRTIGRASGSGPLEPILTVSISDCADRFAVEVLGSGSVDRFDPYPDDEMAITIMEAVVPEYAMSCGGGQMSVRMAWDVADGAAGPTRTL